MNFQHSQRGSSIVALLIASSVLLLAGLGLGYAIKMRNQQAKLQRLPITMFDVTEDFRKVIGSNFSAYVDMDGNHAAPGQCLPGNWDKSWSHSYGLDGASYQSVSSISVPADAPAILKEAGQRCSNKIVPDTGGSRAHFCLKFNKGGNSPAGSFLDSDFAFAEVRFDIINDATGAADTCYQYGMFNIRGTSRPLIRGYYTLYWEAGSTGHYSHYTESFFVVD